MKTQGQKELADTPTREDELALIEQVQEGDQRAFTTLFNRYRQRVGQHAQTLMQCEADAEDILQDVFTTLYAKSEAFRGESAVSTWLYRVTVNTALSLKRYRQRRRTLSLDDLDRDVRQRWTGRAAPGSDTLDEGLIKAEMLQRLQLAIENLSPLDRAVVTLGELQGHSNRTTGEMLGLSEAAVKSRRHRVRLHLRQAVTAFV